MANKTRIGYSEAETYFVGMETCEYSLCTCKYVRIWVPKDKEIYTQKEIPPVVWQSKGKGKYRSL